MKQKKITDTMQKVAVDILSDFEVLTMTHNGPYTFDEICKIVHHHMALNIDKKVLTTKINVITHIFTIKFKK